MTLCTCCFYAWHGIVHGRSEPGRAVARWKTRGGNVSLLCQPCLDGWFDSADDDPSLEPESWAWLTETRQPA